MATLATDKSSSLEPAVVEAVFVAPTVTTNFEGVDPSFILSQLLELTTHRARPTHPRDI